MLPSAVAFRYHRPYEVRSKEGFKDPLPPPSPSRYFPLKSFVKDLLISLCKRKERRGSGGRELTIPLWSPRTPCTSSTSSSSSSSYKFRSKDCVRVTKRKGPPAIGGGGRREGKLTTNLFSYVENSLRQAEEKRRERKRRRLRKLRLVGKVREEKEGGEEEKKLGAPVFVQEDSNVVCVQHIREGWSPTHTRGWWLLRKNSDWREEAGGIARWF